MPNRLTNSIAAWADRISSFLRPRRMRSIAQLNRRMTNHSCGDGQLTCPIWSSSSTTAASRAGPTNPRYGFR